MYDASQKTEVRDKMFDLLFLRTPISIIGTGKIEGIELAVNHLEGKKNFYVILLHIYLFIKHYYINNFL